MKLLLTSSKSDKTEINANNLGSTYRCGPCGSFNIGVTRRFFEIVNVLEIIRCHCGSTAIASIRIMEYIKSKIYEGFLDDELCFRIVNLYREIGEKEEKDGIKYCGWCSDSSEDVDRDTVVLSTDDNDNVIQDETIVKCRDCGHEIPFGYRRNDSSNRYLIPFDSDQFDINNCLVEERHYQVYTDLKNNINPTHG